MALLLPDIAQARRFLSILDPEADVRSLLGDGPDGFSFQVFDDNKKRKDRSLARVINATLDSAYPQLERYNQAGAGVFVTINQTDLKGRTLENVISVRAVWIDDDEGLGIVTPLEPHLVTESSPGKFQKIFLVDGLSIVQHKQVQETLVNEYGCDPFACDAARVLRLAGFWHQKGDPFLVHIIHESGKDPYPAEVVLEAFKHNPDAPVIRPTKVASPKAKASATTSEDEYRPLSENDALPLPDINLESAEKYLPPAGDQSYAEWRDVGMALHHQFYGSDEALALFDSWSQGVREYQGFEDVEKAWGSFGKRTSGPIVTFKSLIHAHTAKKSKDKAVQTHTAHDKANRLLDKCDDYYVLIGEVAPKLRKLSSDNVALENDFLCLLMARYAELRPGSVLSKSDAKRAMKARPSGAATEHYEIADNFSNPDTPTWAKDWVWISEDESFYNSNTRVRLTSSGFRGHFDCMLPKGDDAPKDCAQWLRNTNLIPKVMRSLYAPQFERLFAYNGVSYANTYNDFHRCAVPDYIENEEAVELFKRHITLYFGGWNREAHIFCNFLNACILPKPRKVRWAPLLIGAPGDGKSLYFALMGAALGVDNTRAISASNLTASVTSGQSGWAEGHCFGLIEEIKLHGHNRSDVMNVIKPYITNDVVPCRNLYKELRNIPNAANYMALSNYMDGVPIEEGDRRMFVIHSQMPLSSLDHTYFSRLTKAIRDHAGSIIFWLRNLDQHPEFDPDGHAPMTETKKEVIRLTTDELTETVSNILDDEKNEPLYNKQVVCFGALFNRVMMEAAGTVKPDQDYKLSKALIMLGFSKLDRVRVGGERHRVWAKRPDGAKPTLTWAKSILEERLAKSNSSELSLI